MVAVEKRQSFKNIYDLRIGNKYYTTQDALYFIMFREIPNTRETIYEVNVL